jgi:3-oxoacyl-[acyl-carrier-protein] synthase II
MVSRDMPKRRVVITGYGMITPLGADAEETFENATRGKSGIDYLTAFDTTHLPCRIGGQVNEEWIEKDDPEADRFYKFSSRGLRLMRKATLEAAGRARLHDLTNRERIGVSFGFHGDSPEVEDMMFLHRFYDGKGTWNMQGLWRSGGYSFLNFLKRKPDVATTILPKMFNCKGPNLTVASACAAGSQAIGEACRLIQDGKADVMIAGGSEAPLNFMGFIGFVLIKALAERYSVPQKASRPFDRKRNGFVMSEGAGAVILEGQEHARLRKIPILGEVLGYGASADAYRITDTHPAGLGAVLAMKGALEDASLRPEEIDYINLPTINQEFHDPKCDLDYVPNEARLREHRVALSNSFGFGGQNACLCVGRYVA